MTTHATTTSLTRTGRLGLARGAVEIRTFFRERDTVLFTFALPIVLLVLLGSIFSTEYAGTGVTASQHITASMIAAGIASATFVTLAVGIAEDQANGTLKRLRGMPAPPAAYVLGKLLLVLVVSVTEAVLMVTTGVLLFDLALPADAGSWLTLAWVFLLGATACSLLGIVLSGLARSVRGASAAANLTYLVLVFTSGIFVTPITVLPAPLTTLSSLFPLKWMGQGFRAAFLPDTMATQELAGSWELGRVALVLGLWCIVGLLLSLAVVRRGLRRRE